MKADNMSALPERRCLARWQLVIMDRRKLNADDSQDSCKNRTARAVPLLLESDTGRPARCIFVTTTLTWP